jgi:hypothetical protein
MGAAESGTGHDAHSIAKWLSFCKKSLAGRLILDLTSCLMLTQRSPAYNIAFLSHGDFTLQLARARKEARQQPCGNLPTVATVHREPIALRAAR